MQEAETLYLELAELIQSWGDASFTYAGPASEEEIAAAERELHVVFPRSYRVFLRHYGSGTMPYEIFGLPGDSLWGDLVMMNQLESDPMPSHYIRFTDRIGEYTYYLDTSQLDAEGDCPVVMFGPDEEGTIVADNFLDFLRKLSAGLI